MTTVADVGSTIDTGLFIAFLVWAATAHLFVWIGATLNRKRTHCGGCDECDQLTLKPLTDAEIERGIHALEYHLARRRGLHVYNQEEQS